ncbi:hypothetical protein ACIOKD_13410 [Streptomyces sp. NPDC087844]|uniref:hypothetical protein n=1 Tax=Streptomyces sp. NPDC087844 TaxID=3365805 RepID=UPI0038119F05
MDCSGIDPLIAAPRAAQDARGRLRVAGARQSVPRVIEPVGVDALVPCRPTLRQAPAS